MPVQTKEITVSARRAGLHEVTDECARFVREVGVEEAQLVVFCRHTSCSLVLMENADPSARHDLEGWLDRLVDPEDPHFTHTLEGADDMPSHIKMALTRSSETIPVLGGRLALGTWQGIFLWEHRTSPHRRRLVLSLLS
ncbi:MAG: secondary thiamine-phosphate synthase enzyme YjbQ [Verrucomicrobiota bacterium]